MFLKEISMPSWQLCFSCHKFQRLKKEMQTRKPSGIQRVAILSEKRCFLLSYLRWYLGWKTAQGESDRRAVCHQGFQQLAGQMSEQDLHPISTPKKGTQIYIATMLKLLLVWRRNGQGRLQFMSRPTKSSVVVVFNKYVLTRIVHLLPTHPCCCCCFTSIINNKRRRKKEGGGEEGKENKSSFFY